LITLPLHRAEFQRSDSSLEERNEKKWESTKHCLLIEQTFWAMPSWFQPTTNYGPLQPINLYGGASRL